jgi:methyl-accepting chemotaxis protein
MKINAYLKALLIISIICCNVGAFVSSVDNGRFVSAEPFVFEQKMYGGIGDEHSTCTQPTSDGGLITTVHDGDRSYILKTNNLGNKEWQKNIDLTSVGVVWCNSIQQTQDGGYIIAGEIDVQSTGILAFNHQILLIKTDAAGTQQWYKTIGGETKDIAYSVQVTPDGGYIIGGSTEKYGTLLRNSYVVKTDSSGKIIWEKSFGGNLDNIAYCLQVTSDGGFVIAGFISTLNARWDIYLIKLDSSGNEMWEKTIGGARNDVAYSIQTTSDGGLIIAGSTASFGTNLDIYLIKTDSSGNKVWEKNIGGPLDDFARSIQVTPDGGYIIAGQTLSFGGKLNVYLVKVDSSGNKMWEKNFGGEEDDIAVSVQVTTEGGYLTVGDSNSFSAGYSDVYLVRLYDMGQVTNNLKTGLKEQNTSITNLSTQTNDLQSSLQSTNNNISKLQSDLQSSNNQIKDLQTSTNDQIKDLQSSLESAKNMNTIALVIAVIGVICAITSIILRRK